MARGPARVEQPAGTWLIAADRGGVGTALAERLGQQGQTCVLVDSGAAQVRLEAGHYQVAGGEAAAWERLLARFPRLFIALDNDAAGRQATAALRTALGPRALPVTLPGVKDVAELAAHPDGEALFRGACAAAFRRGDQLLAA